MAGSESLDTLKRLGLTGNEAKVYLALCELGPSSAAVAAEKAEVHRALAYGTLARLAGKGLVSRISRQGKQVFEAASPEHLQSLVEERERKLKEDVASLTGMLAKVYRVSPKPSVEVFTGVEGLKALLSEELASTKRGDIIYYYRAQAEIARAAKVFVAWYHKRRAEQGVRAMAVFDSSPLQMERAKEFAKLQLAEVRILSEALPTPVTYHVFGDKVGIISLTKDEWLAILIKSEAVSSFFRNSFEFTWKKLKPI